MSTPPPLLSPSNEGQMSYFDLYASSFKFLISGLVARIEVASIYGVLRKSPIVTTSLPKNPVKGLLRCPFHRWGDRGSVPCHRAARWQSRDSNSHYLRLRLLGFSHHPTLPPNLQKYPDLSSSHSLFSCLSTTQGMILIDSCSAEVRKVLSHPQVNAGGLLKREKLQAVRAAASLALQGNWLGFVQDARAGSVF